MLQYRLSCWATVGLVLVLVARTAMVVHATEHSYQCEFPAPSASAPPVVSCDVDVLADALTELVANLTTDTVVTGFEGEIHAASSGSVEFEAVRDQYGAPNFPDRTRPTVIARALTETDVRAVVLYAAQCEYALKIRSGGHSYLALSSCEVDESPCLQLDVALMNQTQVLTGDDGSVQLQVGPGLKLEGMHELLAANGVFVPTGECAKVGIGGHTQTGGYGMWGRQFGPMAGFVDSFRIVLADGSAHDIVTPTDDTSALNDDLFFAVLGGASGSWGVLTQITFNTVKDQDYFHAYWRAYLAWSNIDGLVNQFRVWSDLANTNKMDTRWSTHTTFGTTFDPGAPLIVEWEMAWVSPVAEADDYDPQFFQTILDACIGCFPLGPIVNETLPLSFVLNEFYTSVDDGREYPPLPLYEKAWQQTSTFPSPEQMEAIIRKVEQVKPGANGTFTHAFTTQMSTGAPGIPDKARGLPFQTDVYGITTDFFYVGDMAKPFVADLANEYNGVVLDSFGGEDHRMYWGAYGDPSFPRDVGLYFDSDETFKRLQNIKACVDPNNLFRHRMSIPLPESVESPEPTASPTTSPTASPVASSSEAFRQGVWIVSVLLAIGILV